MSVLIKNVTILDSNSKYHQKKADVFYQNGKIQQIGKNLQVDAIKILDDKNAFLSPAWIDIMADYCDPGYEYKETIVSGLAAANNGGYGTVFLSPTTQPIVANKTMVDYINQQNKHPHKKVYALGAISKNGEGKELAEMLDMHHAGAIAFTDAWKPVQNAQLLLKALEYVKAFNGIIIQLPINEAIAKGGLMNEGINSVQWGMPGIPNVGEHLQVQHDIELLRYTGSRLHIAGVSTAGALKHIKQAKKEGLDITCSVTPYHLLFTDDVLSTYDSNFKVAPPLRSEKDRKALIKGIEDGTIDCIVSQHRPHEWDAKAKEYEYTATGMMVQETTLSMLLQAAPHITMDTWTNMLVHQPAKIFNLSVNTIQEGMAMPLTYISPEHSFMYSASTKKSKGINSPLLNTVLKGKAIVL